MQQIYKRTPMPKCDFSKVDFNKVVFLKHPFWDSPFCLITDEFLLDIYIKPNKKKEFWYWSSKRKWFKLIRGNIWMMKTFYWDKFHRNECLAQTQVKCTTCKKLVSKELKLIQSVFFIAKVQKFLVQYFCFVLEIR